MLTQLLIGTLILALTVGVSGIFTLVATQFLVRMGAWIVRPPHNLRSMIALVAASLWVQLAVSVSVLLWAITFRVLGIFEGMEPAIYFALVSFTTLGFGDVLLPEQWRLLSGFAASNGLLLFGFFTAFLVELVRRVRQEQTSGRPDVE